LSRSEVQAQEAALRGLGWVERKNLVIERRYAQNRVETLESLAQELVRLKVDVIVTWGTPATLAARNATDTIPIVMATAGDPVRAGLAASLSRPGGNVTGFSIAGPEINAKRVALLRELLPDLQRVGVLDNPGNPYYRVVRKDFEDACRAIGIEPIFVEVRSADELEPGIAELARRRSQALFVQRDDLFIDNRMRLMSVALAFGLPTIVSDIRRRMVEAGALISYAHSPEEEHQRNAAFIDRILRGAKPADLPIEQPTKFELIINLKAAKVLGIAVPQTLLLRADEVIQ
jgi:putative ABC transport system substrate-binding protein